MAAVSPSQKSTRFNVDRDLTQERLAQLPEKVRKMCKKLTDEVQPCVKDSVWKSIDVRYIVTHAGIFKEARILCSPLTVEERRVAADENRQPTKNVNESHSVKTLKARLRNYNMWFPTGEDDDEETASDDDDDQQQQQQQQQQHSRKRKRKSVSAAAGDAAGPAADEGDQWDDLHGVRVPKRKASEGVQPWLSRMRDAATTKKQRALLVAALHCVQDDQKLGKTKLSQEQMRIVDDVLVKVEMDMGIVHPTPPTPPPAELVDAREALAQKERENRELRRRLQRLEMLLADADDAQDADESPRAKKPRASARVEMSSDDIDDDQEQELAGSDSDSDDCDV